LTTYQVKAREEKEKYLLKEMTKIQEEETYLTYLQSKREKKNSDYEKLDIDELHGLIVKTANKLYTASKCILCKRCSGLA
jgi:hypothetical protein